MCFFFFLIKSRSLFKILNCLRNGFLSFHKSIRLTCMHIKHWELWHGINPPPFFNFLLYYWFSIKKICISMLTLHLDKLSFWSYFVYMIWFPWKPWKNTGVEIKNIIIINLCLALITDLYWVTNIDISAGIDHVNNTDA
jgi:hypothetical protein